MKSFKETCVLISIFSLTSCATITQGTTEALIIESEPQGAQVQLSNGQSCISTPCAIEVARKQSLSITVSKGGCRTKIVNVISTMSVAGGAGLAGNVIAGGVIGLGVDAVTGAAKHLQPNPVKVKLEC